MSKVIYGIHPVSEILRYMPKNVKTLWIDKLKKEKVEKIALLAGKNKIPMEFVSRAFLDKECKRAKHQGVACKAADFSYVSLKEFLERKTEKKRLIVIADQIQDPQNLGSMLRAMGAFGADLLIIGKRRGAGITPAVIKTSEGGALVVPVARENSLSNTIERLKKNGFWVYGLDVDGESDLDSLDLEDNIVLVVGSEGGGLSKLVKEKCHALCRLPQSGKIQSLNAAMAVTCALYETGKQRQKPKEK